MTERPILFSAPMVRALLAGTKTQTRRVVKGFALEWLTMHDGFNAKFVTLPENHLCPYGLPGDRLWVRETWAALTSGYAYAADPIWNSPPAGRWRPSIHMPRAASRILLEITGVRVERLQGISEEDAVAEGIEKTQTGFWKTYGQAAVDGTYAPRTSYAMLWKTINGPGSWDANPWVWVVEFKRVTP